MTRFNCFFSTSPPRYRQRYLACIVPGFLTFLHCACVAGRTRCHRVLGALCLLLFLYITSSASATVVVTTKVNPSNGHLYKLLRSDISSFGLTWTDSEAAAVGLGGHLVTVNDSAENAWILSNFTPSGSLYFYLWIGFNDAASEGNFVWSSGQPVTYTNWASGEPNNTGGGEDHTYTRNFADFKWNDDVNVPALGSFPISGIAEIDPVATTYRLSALSVANPTIILGGTTTFVSRIQNTGTGASDRLSYNGVNAVASSGSVIGGPSGAGGPLLQSGLANQFLTFNSTGATPGSVVLTPTVILATNTTLGSDATQEAGSPFTSTVTVLDHADAEFVGGSGNTLALDFGTLTSNTGTHSLTYQISTVRL